MAALVATVPATPSIADYDAECGSPTRTLAGGGSAAIDVAAGEVLLLSQGTYTGGFNSLPSGAVVCVADDASWVPQFAYNAKGSMYVRGAVTFNYFYPQLKVSADNGVMALDAQTGFLLDNEGTVTVTGTIVTAGPSKLINRKGATWTVSQRLGLTQKATFTNEGFVDLRNGIDLDTGTSFDNSGTAQLRTLNNIGSVTNTGLFEVGAAANTGMRGGSFVNACRARFGASYQSDGPTTNNGVIELSGALTVNGAWTQSAQGISVGTSDFYNRGAMTGFGQYLFDGTTQVQGTFIGSDAGAPIVFDDSTPTGAIFDQVTGTVTNVVAGDVTPPADDFRPSGCTAATDTAEINVVKTGPAKAKAGDVVVYTIAVTNDGSAAVAGMTLEDVVPEQLKTVTWTCTSTGGTCGSPSGTGNDINLTLDLPAGASATVQVEGTLESALDTIMTNTATVSMPDGVTNTGTASDSAVTTGVANDLAIAVQDPGLLTPGGQGTLKVQVTNNGPDDAVSMSQIIIKPPDEVTFTSAPSGCTLLQNGSVNCLRSAATLPNGTMIDFDIPFTVDASAPADSSLKGGLALVENVHDPRPANNLGVYSVTTGPRVVKVTLEKSVSD